MNPFLRAGVPAALSRAPSLARSLPLAIAGTAIVAVLAGCAQLPSMPGMSDAARPAPELTPCPVDLSGLAKCYTGRDDNGAQYWIAIPHQWNKTLIMHAHGGPRLSPISRDSNLEDLERFSVNVRQGYAWAGSSYRRPGYGVRMAAEDTENLRKIFIQAFGKPKYTILHGQSWGGNVAAKGIELYAANYDGLVLTNGMLAGGTKNYLHRADLRAVYEQVCKNHPRPDEPAYPLWMGLPAGTKMTGKELEERVNECTGVRLKPDQRSAQQKRNLADILGVVHVPERTLVSHLSWATFMFRDLTQRVLENRSPFTNKDVVYRGSGDDAALNRGVMRFEADPVAVERLAYDSDMSGDLRVPAISMHAINDPTAMVEYEAEYRDVVARKGAQDKLLQVFTTEKEHSKLADAEYAAVFDTLMDWVRNGKRPAVADVAARCQQESQRFAGGCHVEPGFVPQPLFSRVPRRDGKG
ncbi:alpha/beta hydrolase [Noviherbaspirillum galbum]|uniref:Alpha/beta hydrolase n=1 Tax=Noviherbaspirillum galbum TaxID=2709383 RepID=A0A6B3SJ19_9BURK|nr:alpha/beta hydrolase [Noviherbaspirillum galbum]NEX60854.1 alpha/beta hydrolase [Noviherbaspirillum galbum]